MVYLGVRRRNMAEFIGIIGSDFSLPLPKTNSICLLDLKFRYEEYRRTILLFQTESTGAEELFPCIVRNRTLIVPREILEHMGLSPGARFYYVYWPTSPDMPILIKKDDACARCGDYSIPRLLRRPIFRGDNRGVCSKCRKEMWIEVHKDILDFEDCPDNGDTEYNESELSSLFKEILAEDIIEESRNGTLGHIER